MSDQPIGNHAMLSDCHSAALVDRDGSVEWWCAPHFDSPSVFARILDPGAGHFSVTPRDVVAVERAYREGTLILDTRFITSSGVLELADALLMGENERGHDLGLGSPHVLARLAVCTDGEVEIDVEFAPRFEYGLTAPLIVGDQGGVLARGGPTAIRLSTSVTLDTNGSVASGTLTLEQGDRVGFALETGSSWNPPTTVWTDDRIASRIEDTAEAWVSWGRDHQSYTGPYSEMVMHSGRVLQGLTYRPTGAMVAAPTTSLPETIGGDRNWDYRYCWLRDASFTLRALWVAACPDEAGTYLDYMTAASSSVYERGQIQIMFGIHGERDLTERTLPWLRGWRDSSPVRVGNGAWEQSQHDVYGELLSAVHRLREQIGRLDAAERRLLVFLADRAAEVWREPDHGIWEVRGEPRHYLYSKLMCWVALDRAIDLSSELDAADRTETWLTAREEIRNAIEEQGWSPSAGAFTQTFGSDDLDASSLVIPLVGFLPADDERVLSTVEAIQRRLMDDRGLVYRYLSDDGLEGAEGTFLLCTFWLSEALAGAGKVTEARRVFENAIGYCNDVGLLAEEVDTPTGEMIGNFPQAFSHVGLINAAWAIARAEEG